VARFVIRRLIQSIFTLFGVMLLTFLLFNVIAGDIASQYQGPRATEAQRQDFLEKYDLDLPELYNTKPGLAWHERFTETLFVRHMVNSVTFRAESFVRGETLLEIIGEKARYSLSITVPALALGFFSAMVVSCLVAYYRGTWVDQVGVFLGVLGMCIPVLAYMIVGQYMVFRLAPEMAYGIQPRTNIFVPVIIATVAGLGGAVRFYRTVILNEINQDYVRTARAKGVPLPSILFKHVLKNCMLPILTNLVVSIPFLILGSLLLEQFFGVPGLGDLMISSISRRDVPIINGLTFLTALIYTLGLLITDILYAVFDPRIRLQ
jgi:peptide/nickel transport system permease protein